MEPVHPLVAHGDGPPVPADRRASTHVVDACIHCGARGAIDADGFCCAGCERVHRRLGELGLDRYYELLSESPTPVGDASASDTKWLEPLEAELAASDGLHRVRMDLAGIHCAACVWVVDELFARQPGGARCVVNPVRGAVELTVDRSFPLRDFARTLEEIGYRPGPSLKERAREVDGLTVRMGISLALALHTMMLSFAIYFGLAEGRVYEALRQVDFALATVTVIVGGAPFFTAAWRGLRRGVVHLDLPIAVGIGLAFAGSAYSFFADAGADYFDTLAIFIALMLVGRWTQERILAQNRARLLASDGVEGLYARRIEADKPALVRCTSLERGDALLLAMGDLVPVDATLESACELRLDWINGESEPRAFEAGERAPAGAFLASAVAVRARCLTGFADSALVELLTTPERDRGDRWFDRLGRVYVALVLLAAAGAFGIWIVIGDLTSALSVTTAVLVVSCPCAFGIAAPLAFDLVQASLRQAGVFVRSPSLLSRMRGVRRAVFDKTGTLTTGTPRLADPSALEPLDGRARAALYDLAASSAHPKARAILAHLDGALTPGVIVHEVTSSGLELWRDGHRYRLGRPAWASPERAFDPAIDLVFSEDARPLAALRTREALRPAVREELAALREAGLEVFVLSGDSGEKVAALARELGLPEDHAIGGCTSEDKASWIRAHDPDRTLFVGDGINDALAADAALVSGTPAVETPFMAARTDFYFVGSRVAPIAALFDHARRLRRVLNVILTIAVLYNAGAVTLAYLGLIEPWVAAVLMPASSIVTIAVATLGLRSARSRRSTWKP